MPRFTPCVKKQAGKQQKIYPVVFFEQIIPGDNQGQKEKQKD
jgi:hypothetical protein